MRDFLDIIALCGGFVLSIILVAMIGSRHQCNVQWNASGMASNWGPVQGCLIQLKDGRWVPAENYREIKP